MSQPVKLSDALVLEARIAGEANERSIAGQVEFWAKLGKSIEMMMEGRQVLALRQKANIQPLSEALASVSETAGKRHLASYLDSQPFPHFKQHPTQSGLLIRIDENGSETVGRFVNRVFVPAVSNRAIQLRKSVGVATSKTVIQEDFNEAKPAKQRKVKRA